MMRAGGRVMRCGAAGQLIELIEMIEMIDWLAGGLTACTRCGFWG